MNTLDPKPYCEAPIRYLGKHWKGSAESARIGDRDSRRKNTERHIVPIIDCREVQGKKPFDLDREGFLLTKMSPAASDLRDSEKVETLYYAQIKALLRELTGADHVFPYQHQIRTEDPSDFNNAYARFIHSDYGMENRNKTATTALAEWGIELDHSKKWDFAWYNLWQPIDWEVQQNPLAIIDFTTLERDDLVGYYYTGDAGGRGGLFRSTMPVFNPGHRVCFFSRMQTDEIMVFKQLETRKGRALSCPHTSFDDPNAPSDALPRRSIETRTMCAFATEV